jgi:hypothetical protein
MTEFRLHRELYDAQGVQAALDVYKSYATLELSEEPAHWLVKVTGKSPGRELRLGRELSNYALGLTIKGRKA